MGSSTLCILTGMHMGSGNREGVLWTLPSFLLYLYGFGVPTLLDVEEWDSLRSFCSWGLDTHSRWGRALMRLVQSLMHGYAASELFMDVPAWGTEGTGS